jgi:DNA-binding response OmpR family regulator
MAKGDDVRVLIVDDEELMVRTMSMVLRSVGYRVDTASNGAEALDMLMGAGTSYDLVVSDIQMPAMTGDQLIEELRYRNIEVPVLVTTGFGTKDLVVELMRKGCTDYIDKPFTAGSFLERVNEVLDKVRVRNESNGNHSEADRDYRALVNYEIDRHRDELRALRSQVEAAVQAYSNLVAVNEHACTPTVAWRNRPLADLGGDFLGLRSTRGGCSMILADVAGHDMGASYHSVLIKTLFEDNCADGRDGEALFQILNRALIETGTERMVTAVHLRFRKETRRVEVVCAAHPAVLYVPADGGDVGPIRAEGTVLGILDTVTHDTKEVALSPGDRLVLYTDGVPALCRVDGPTGRCSRLSPSGVERLVERHRGEPLHAMVDRIWDDAMAFGRRRLEDDTMLVAVEIPEV